MATAINPFDLTKTSGNDLASGAQSAMTAPTATGYNAATAGATGYTAADAGATGYTASTGNLNTWDADSPSTQNNQSQTVANQITGLISNNSPLLQKARADSLAQMNSRGLANSSMALGEGQKAVIASALPIAQQDANTFAQQAQFNASQGNTMNQFNAGQTNQAQQFTAGAKNTADLTNAGAENQAAQFTAGATNTAALTNAGAQNQAAQFSAGATNEASKQYSTALNSTVQNMMDQSMKYALANADAQTKVELQNIDATTRKDLAATEAAYKNQMQASQSSNDIFQQVSKNISDLMQNPDLDTAAKQAAVNSQKAYLQNALSILSATSGVSGLKDLLSFPAP